MSDRNYSDEKLADMAQWLDEGEEALLKAAGALPQEKFGELEPRLTSKDVAALIREVE